MQVHAAPPADPPPPSWTIVASPNANEPTMLQAVAAHTSNDVWAVGYHFNPTIPPPSPTPSSTFIQHWDGSTWSSVSVPNPGYRNELYGVAVRAANDAWAVGGANTTYSGLNWQSLILHWNGSAWSEMVRPALSNNILYGVTVLDANNAWAVGTWSAFPTQPCIFHWDGTDWSTVYAPSSYAYGGYLYGITARTATDVWAVGYENTNATTAVPLTLHWDGVSWQVVPSLNAVTGVRSLVRNVAMVAANNVWAVGQTIDSGNNVSPLSIHWNGTNWSTIAQAGGSPKLLTGVTALSANDVWEVGVNNTSGTPATLIVHWDGTALSDQTSPNQPGENDLYGVAAVAPDDIWAVGRSNAGINQFQTLTLHYTAGTPACMIPTPFAYPWGCVAAPTPITTPTAPSNTTSYYVQATRTPPPAPPPTSTPTGWKGYWYQAGYNQAIAAIQGRATSRGVVVLDFGKPWFNVIAPNPDDDQWGAKLTTKTGLGPYPYISSDEITKVAGEFAQGFADGAQTSPTLNQPHITLAIGTNNFDDGIWTPIYFRRHGQHWGTMVVGLSVKLGNLQSWVNFEGGNDIEFDWSSAETALRWTQGYEEVTRSNPSSSAHYYYSYSSCDDCYPPNDPNRSQVCSGSHCWSVDEVVGVNWANRAAYPLPQIYFPWGGKNTDQSAQWKWVSSYSNTHYICLADYGIPGRIYGSMRFEGVMADPNALPSDRAWQNLWVALKQSSCTTYGADSLWFVTPIEYYP